MKDAEIKRRIGFATSATELQDKFDELSAKVDEREKYWNKLRAYFRNETKEVREETGREKDKLAILALTNFRQCLVELQAMCLLGEDIARIQRHIVDLEKSIDKLHLKVK